MAAAPPRRCPACGAELPKDTIEGLCPACLFARALEEPSDVSATMSGEGPMMLSPISTPELPASREAPRLPPGLLRQSGAADALGEAGVVADHRAGPRLAADGLMLDDQGLQAF